MIIGLELPVATKTSKDFMKGDITSPVSHYNPSKKIKDRIAEIKEKFAQSFQIQNKPYEEFNNKSLRDHINELQKLFLSYREPKSTDRDEAWKSNALRPIVRNRAISIAAHVTGMVIEPNVDAQNEHQEEDKDAAAVMEDLMDWANEQASYVRTFLYAVIAAIVNPAVIIHTEYAQHHKITKEVKEDGSWTEKTVIDEVMSGFQDSIVPVDELFIADIYEHNLQKQPYLIWRRVLNWSTAVSKYMGNQNFKDYVRPGLQVVFDEGTDLFYQQFDEELRENLVEEVIYYDRTQDLQLIMVNGVLLTDPDHPNPRLDKRYPFIKGGYELIDEGKFFYYFSLVRKMKDDAEIVNRLYQMVIDGTFLQLMPPTALFGDETVNSSVVTPGTVNTFKENTRLERIDVGNNISAGLNALDKLETSISESSQDVLQQGLSESGGETAFEISRREKNAAIMLGLFGKMISQMVKEWGELRVSDIVQFLTVADIGEIVGENTILEYPSFFLDNRKTEKGKHRIVFDNGITDQLSEDELTKEVDMFALQGGANVETLPTLQPEKRKEFVKKGVEGDTKLYLINPEKFRKLKYKVKIVPDVSTPPSDSLNKALNLELYDRAIQNPLSDQEEVTRELLFGSYKKTKRDVDKFIAKQEQTPIPGTPGQGSDVLSKMFGQQKGLAMGTEPAMRL